MEGPTDVIPVSSVAEVPSRIHPLSFDLRMPERIVVSGTGGRGHEILLHVEIRNRNDVPWEASADGFPLLAVSVFDDAGSERSHYSRSMAVLSRPTKLDPGRGFLFPVRLAVPEIPAEGATFIVRLSFGPGPMQSERTLRLEPRA